MIVVGIAADERVEPPPDIDDFTFAAQREPGGGRCLKEFDVLFDEIALHLARVNFIEQLLGLGEGAVGNVYSGLRQLGRLAVEEDQLDLVYCNLFAARCAPVERHFQRRHIRYFTTLAAAGQFYAIRLRCRADPAVPRHSMPSTTNREISAGLSFHNNSGFLHHEGTKSTK